MGGAVCWLEGEGEGGSVPEGLRVRWEGGEGVFSSRGFGGNVRTSLTQLSSAHPECWGMPCYTPSRPLPPRPTSPHLRHCDCFDHFTFFLSFSLPPAATHQPALPAKFPTIQSIQFNPTGGYENGVRYAFLLVGGWNVLPIGVMADHSRVSCLHFAFAFGQDGRWCGEGHGAVLYFSGEFGGGSVGMLSLCDIYFLLQGTVGCGGSYSEWVGMYHSMITVIGQMQGYLGISVSTAETICGELS